MQTVAAEQIDDLPEDVAAAWATVLLDLWEKRKTHDRARTVPGAKAASATVMEDEADGD